MYRLMFAIVITGPGFDQFQQSSPSFELCQSPEQSCGTQRSEESDQLSDLIGMISGFGRPVNSGASSQ
jgi:hypothetical protein